MSYVKTTKHYRLTSWIGDPIEDLRLHLYSDADFAGCQTTNKSTTGVFMALEGPRSFVPVATVSKKQSCVSYSTPEAELVAGAFALRQVGTPAAVMWDVLYSSCRAGARG